MALLGEAWAPWEELPSRPGMVWPFFFFFFTSPTSFWALIPFIQFVQTQWPSLCPSDQGCCSLPSMYLWCPRETHLPQDLMGLAFSCHSNLGSHVTYLGRPSPASLPTLYPAGFLFSLRRTLSVADMVLLTSPVLWTVYPDWNISSWQGPCLVHSYVPALIL